MVEGIGRMIEDCRIHSFNQPRSSSASASSVDLIVHVSDRVPETALIDETFLLRICMNLLSNALKFTEQGYILISLDLTSSHQLIIKVQDTGIGNLSPTRCSS